MDTLFSAVVGELVSRSFSFLIHRCSSKLQSSLPSNEGKIQRLERMLIRLAVAIEEAEGRRITNHAMLRQLNILRQDMHRGYYVLDTFRFLKAHEEDDDEVSCNTLALSKINPFKRARVLNMSRRHGDRVEIEQVLDNIEVIMAGMAEFVMLLNNYPYMNRQPYNTYMFMDKCMFGRQMEMEIVVNFLLHPESPNSANLGVLPIIGPAKVGKSTLVEHVCYVERVRNHFSHIIFLSDNDFREEKPLLTLKGGRLVRHKHNSSSPASSGGRTLVVVELADDVDQDEWTRMYTSSQSIISAGSKIIVTSRSEKIAKLGTTQPLHLKFLSREAYWYFFKALAFGSSDPKEHPEAASASMMLFNDHFDQEMNKNFIGPFIELSNLAVLIQASVNEGSCFSLVECARLCFHEHARDKGMNQSLLSTGSGDSGLKRSCVFIPRINETVHYYCEIYDDSRVGRAHDHEETPRFDMQDVLSGRVAPRGRFDLVLWRSHLPPYYSYIYSCEIHEYRPVATCRMELREKKRKI